MSQIIRLVTKQGDPNHWNAMIYGLIYAISASMSDECSGFRVTWNPETTKAKYTNQNKSR